MKDKMFRVYMECARSFASLSHAQRSKVGAVAVTPQDVIIYSYNGTASGDDNNCEDIVYASGNEYEFLDEEWIARTYPHVDQYGSRYKLITKDEVLHSEQNIIAKAAREGISLKGATIFVTMSPCLICSKQIVQAGVTRVVYDEEYRIFDGITYLKNHNVEVIKYEGCK